MAVDAKVRRGGGPRRRGYTRVSSKNQVTLPVYTMRLAGFRPGDELRAELVGPGQLLLARTGDPLRLFSGALTSVFRERELDKLRNEWG